jgi:ACT domain-containing protein
MDISEERLRRIVEETKRQMGPDATDEQVKSVVMEAVRRLEHPSLVEEHASTFKYLNKTEGRVIVTAFGKNKPGVISSISQTLADCRCDILDLSQKIMQEFFTLIMIVDIRNAVCPFGAIKERLGETSERLGIRILAQHEDVFNAMHRI